MLKKPQKIDIVKSTLGFGGVIEDNVLTKVFDTDGENERTPTADEITAVNDAYTAKLSEYDAAEYKRNRADAYPSIGDQLDMIFHAGLGGDEFQAAIQAVKDANPKPSE